MGGEPVAYLTIAAILMIIIMLYLVWRTWYLAGVGLRSFLFFRRCRLLSKSTLVESAEGRLAVRRFTFALPEGSDDLGLDLSRGEYVKVRAAGVIPRSRSYSPVAARPGEFDLMVKIYPPHAVPNAINGMARRAGVSSSLDSLNLGDFAYVSGPFPVPLSRVVRDAGKRVGLIAYGIGITEALTVARGELARGDAGEVVLLWALREIDECFVQPELQILEASGLKVHYHYSREHGRLDTKRLHIAFPWADQQGIEQRFLVVGTKRMMRDTHRMLAEAGIAYKMLLKKRLGIRRPPEQQTNLRRSDAVDRVDDAASETSVNVLSQNVD
eukprot:TRINITY_DN64801_c0_g1_i1.p1 TRINITY_DN64801_c0_g1~~TRINITY_DN64801_c0_g1_i1.p1  ORF type:complete len:336 (-),score=30.72 TRINITY_DN64801_c0_g1_i1:111-1091(-)